MNVSTMLTGTMPMCGKLANRRTLVHGEMNFENKYTLRNARLYSEFMTQLAWTGTATRGARGGGTRSQLGCRQRVLATAAPVCRLQLPTRPAGLLGTHLGPLMRGRRRLGGV